MTPFFTSSKTFQLTTSQGGRPEGNTTKLSSIIFQLTTSQGGRPKTRAVSFFIFRLSTHDLTRRSTLLFLDRMGRNGLSTHDLTRRSTRYSARRWQSCSLSTHDLTRRSTRIFPKVFLILYLSTHDLTRRSTISKLKGCTSSVPFKSRHHKEDD